MSTLFRVARCRTAPALLCSLLCCVLAGPGLAEPQSPPVQPATYQQNVRPDFASVRTLWLQRAPAVQAAGAHNDYARQQLADSGWLQGGSRLQLSTTQSDRDSREQELSLSLPGFAGLSARQNAARAALSAADSEREATVIEQSAALYRLLAQTQAAQAKLRLLQRQADALNSLLVQSDRRLQAGEISRADYLSWSVEAGAAAVAVLAAEAEVATLDRYWRLGLGPDAPASTDIALPAVTELRPPTTPPQLQQRQAEVVAASAALELAANRWTELELELIYRREQNAAELTRDAETEQFSGLQFTLPLGLSRAQREAKNTANLAARTAAIELGQSERELARTQAEAAALRALKTSQKQQLASAAAQARELSVLRIKAATTGEFDWSRLREHLQQTLAIELAAVDADFQYHDAIAQWAQAYGVPL